MKVNCYICNKEFKVKPSHLARMKSPDRICCSRDCAKEEKSERMLGEGDLNSSHKSDFSISPYGYTLCRAPNHPLSNVDGKVFFHRMIMEEFLRTVHDYSKLIKIDDQWVLSDRIVVHHCDGNRQNNCLENLECLTLEEHTSLHYHQIMNGVVRGLDGKFQPKGFVSSKFGLTRSHVLDAGQDITSAANLILYGNTSALVSTETYVAIPRNYVGLIWARSGLSAKHHIEIGAGCIDSGYTGELKVHLYNHDERPFEIKQGDRIAQLLTVPINPQDYQKVTKGEIDRMNSDSKRKTNGFGSTGGK